MSSGTWTQRLALAAAVTDAAVLPLLVAVIGGDDDHRLIRRCPSS